MMSHDLDDAAVALLANWRTLPFHGPVSKFGLIPETNEELAARLGVTALAPLEKDSGNFFSLTQWISENRPDFAEDLIHLESLDQFDGGSCAAQSTAYALCLMQMIANREHYIVPSRLFIYYNARLLDNVPPSTGLRDWRPIDSGVRLTSAFPAVEQFRVCPESLYPQDLSRINDAPPISLLSYATSTRLKGTTVDVKAGPITSIKRALLSKIPPVISVPLFSSFIRSHSHIPLPVPGDLLTGRHAMCVVGFDDRTQLITLKNSWGNIECPPFLTMDYAYVEIARLQPAWLRLVQGRTQLSPVPDYDASMRRLVCTHIPQLKPSSFQSPNCLSSRNAETCWLTSPNGEHHLAMQNDGNLVVYTHRFHPRWNIWNVAHHQQVQTPGVIPESFNELLFLDGDLVIRHTSPTETRIIWKASTSTPVPMQIQPLDQRPLTLSIMNSGFFVVTTNSGKAVWSNKPPNA